MMIVIVVARVVMVLASMVALPPAQSHLWHALATCGVMVQNLALALMTRCERIRLRSDATESRFQLLVPPEPL